MRYLVVLLLVFVTGCAFTPIVDMRGVDQSALQVDITECERYAKLVHQGSRAAGAAVGGAVVGGGLGAALGALGSGGAPETGAAGAILGAAIAGLGALGSASAEKRAIVVNCLQGRGYHVLNR